MALAPRAALCSECTSRALPVGRNVMEDHDAIGPILADCERKAKKAVSGTTKTFFGRLAQW